MRESARIDNSEREIESYKANSYQFGFGPSLVDRTRFPCCCRPHTCS